MNHKSQRLKNRSFTSAALSLTVIFFVTVPFHAHSAFENHFLFKTLRMDYVHTGTYDTGTISQHEFIEEPLWGGSKINLTDTFGYGRYFFEVRDKRDGELLYSRGYNTLFVEWQDTEEAKIMEKSFNESLVMPFPLNAVIIEIFRRDKQNRSETIFRTHFDPNEELVIRKEPLSYPVYDIINNGPTETKLDVLFIAEGYTIDELGMFKDDCARFAGYLINAAPFREYRDRINIRGVGAISEDSGVTIPGEDIFLNTALGASFYTFGSERYLMVEDFHKVRDAASLAPYDQIFIIVNSDKYGGGGIFNFYATGTRGNRAADFLLLHEFGHSFGGLADEYYTSDVAVSDFYDLSVEPAEPNITTLVDFESKWEDMLSPGTEVPTPENPENSSKIGVYEGGGYLAKGIYRPYIDCTMKSVIYDAFCPVCRRALSRMVLFYSN